MTWIQNYKAPLKFNNEKTNQLITIYINILYPYDNWLLTWKSKKCVLFIQPCPTNEEPWWNNFRKVFGEGGALRNSWATYTDLLIRERWVRLAGTY